MGTFFTNLHIRSAERSELHLESIQRRLSPSFITDSVTGWVSLYPKATENQDYKLLNTLARDLSTILETAIFSFLVHDSDVFLFNLFDKGTLIDTYNSNPSYFGDDDSQQSGGNPAKLLPFAKPGTTESQIDSVLHPKKNSSGPKLPMPKDQMLVKMKEQLIAQQEKLAASGKPTGPSVDEWMRMIEMSFNKSENKGSYLFAEQAAAAFGFLFGIAPERATIGYMHISENSGDGMKVETL